MQHLKFNLIKVKFYKENSVKKYFVVILFSLKKISIKFFFNFYKKKLIAKSLNSLSLNFKEREFKDFTIKCQDLLSNVQKLHHRPTDNAPGSENREQPAL